MSPDTFIALKKEVESLKQKKSRMKGSIEQLQKQLSQDFGIDDLEDLEPQLKEKRIKAKKAKQEVDDARPKYEEKWNVNLGGD